MIACAIANIKEALVAERAALDKKIEGYQGIENMFVEYLANEVGAGDE